MHDVIIAGAGPVGLLLANLLGARGVRTLVLERRTEPVRRSMAIGIMPPALDILRTVGLDAVCVNRGARIRRVVVRDRHRQLGDLDFHRLPSAHPFVLSLPQVETLGILEAGARRFACVEIRKGVDVVGLEQRKGDVAVRWRTAGVAPGPPSEVAASFLVGCDGHASTVRELLGVGVRRKRLDDAFLMADFDDDGALGNDALLCFTETGSVESFPLAGGRRRWVVMTDGLLADPPADTITRLVRERASITLQESRKTCESAFSVNQFICKRYADARVVLCGDAAHVMSPIGGQGMNTGFADAAVLADALAAALGGAPHAPLFRAYDRTRRRAFHAAARLARCGMWIGTRKGRVSSGLRSLLLAQVMLRPPMRDWLAAQFALVTAGKDGSAEPRPPTPFMYAGEPEWRNAVHAES